MDVLQRLQALDVLFALLWAAVIGWGLQTGLVRQLGMLVAVYAGALASGSGYRLGGMWLSLIVGADERPQLEFIAYTALFVVVGGVVAVIIRRAYPTSRLKRGFGLDNLGGGLLAAVWGILLLIGLLTILRFYTAVPWKGQEAGQQSVVHQVQQSQVAPVLQVTTAPLWQVMVPWFPAPVSPRL